MDTLTWTDIEKLAQHREPPVVTIHLPTCLAGREKQQNPIRFRKQIEALEETLQSCWMSPKEVKKFVKPCWNLLEDSDFWREGSRGLAVFLDSQGMQVFQLPFEVNEFMHVGSLFELSPLLQLAQDEVAFHVLAISANSVRLLKVSRGQAQIVEVNGLPESMEQFTGDFTNQASLRFHSTSTRSVHVHGSDAERVGPHSQIRLNEYCRQIDLAIRSVIKTESLPLVLAGEDQIVETFRSESGYEGIVQETVRGNCDGHSPGKLQEAAHEIMKNRLHSIRMNSIAALQELNPEFLSSDIEVLFRAIERGQVRELYLTTDQPLWGICSESCGAVEQHSERREDDENLMNRLVVMAIRKRIPLIAYSRVDFPAGKDLIGRMTTKESSQKKVSSQST
ncbi:MAG: hypothetical protein KDA78_15590 [Planctomycetaceae bacterium]|nr:hypothetical protein [Planctomycetaceae bacterium]